MNTELKENDLEKDFSNQMNNAVSGKVMEHVRKHRETTEE